MPKLTGNMCGVGRKGRGGGKRDTGLASAVKAGRFREAFRRIKHGGRDLECRVGGRTLLHVAAHMGHSDIVQILLSHGADKLATDDSGMAAVHIAAREGHAHVLMTLPPVDDPDSDSRTPLSHAAGSGSERAARVLIARGVDLNARSTSGCTPLMFAVSGGRIGTTRLLLESGADPNAADNRGRSPLHFAARTGRLSLVRILLEHGADASHADEGGKTALGIASYMGYAAIVQILLQKGADVDGTHTPTYAVYIHRSPLALAAERGHERVAGILVGAGARIDGSVPVQSVHDFRRYPLSEAAMSGHLGIVEALVASGADVDYSGDAWDLTPLAHALVNGHERVATFLMSVGAGIDTMDGMGMRPLHYAAASGMLRVARELMSRGVSIDSRDHEGMSPLHHAARCGMVRVARELLHAGADMDPIDIHGRTPLWLASECKRLGVASLLSRRGARSDTRDWMGRTALHRAVDNDTEYYTPPGACAAMAGLLLDAGAAIDAEDHQRMTALDVVIRGGDYETAATLIERGADVRRVDEAGNTVLMLVARHADLVERVIAASDVNARNFIGQTAMMTAAVASADAVGVLLRHGAFPNCPDMDGDTPLAMALYAGNFVAANMLIRAGAGDPGAIIAASYHLDETGSGEAAAVIDALAGNTRMQRKDSGGDRAKRLARAMTTIYAGRRRGHELLMVWCDAAAGVEPAPRREISPLSPSVVPAMLYDGNDEAVKAELRRQERLSCACEEWSDDQTWVYILIVQDLICEVEEDKKNFPEYCARAASMRAGLSY